MDAPAPRRRWSGLTALAVYLKGLRLVLDEAVEARRVWVRHLGALLEEARSAHRATIVQAVGRVGLDQATVFRGVRARLGRLEPPASCAQCHGAVAHWLDAMTAACDVMVEIGRAGELSRLKETQEHLAESRADARRFNTEYERLIGELRRRARAARDAKDAGTPKERAKPAGRIRRLLRRRAPAPRPRGA